MSFERPNRVSPHMLQGILLMLLLTVGFALRVYHLDRWLPDIFEEATPVNQARDFWGWNTGAFDFNPHFFHYPALSFYIHFAFQAIALGIGTLSGDIASLTEFRHLLDTDFPRFILLGRLVTVAFDLGTILVIYLLGRRIGSPWTAWFAAFLLALNAFHIEAAQTIIVDIPLTFFATLTLLFLLDIQTRRRTSDYLRGGIAIGLAAAVKYPAALLTLPLVAAVAPRMISASDRRTVLFRTLATLTVTGIIFLLANPFLLASFDEFLRDLSLEQVHMAVGHFGHDPHGSSVRFYLTAFWSATGVFGIAAIAAFFHAVRKREWEGIYLFLWLLIYLGIISAWQMRAPRYLLPIVPISLLLGTIAIARLGSFIPRPWWKGIVAAAAVFYLLTQAVSLRDYYARVSPPTTNRHLMEWVKGNVHPKSLIALEHYSYDSREMADYINFRIPLNVIYPRMYSHFYKLGWYENFDYIIISSAVYQRYLDRAEEFPIQVDFYRNLGRDWEIVKHILPEGMTGPALTIFHNPTQVRPDEDFANGLYMGLAGMEASTTLVFLRDLSYALSMSGYKRRALLLQQKILHIERLLLDGEQESP
jgi:4-amino-4-deoxy-L-arabinose transferase-like glycosyltransferase